jgi:hypothetical protein
MELNEYGSRGQHERVLSNLTAADMTTTQDGYVMSPTERFAEAADDLLPFCSPLGLNGPDVRSMNDPLPVGSRNYKILIFPHSAVMLLSVCDRSGTRGLRGA